MTEQKEKMERCFCPYCDQELAIANLPFCRACRITLFYCPRCRQPMAKENKICPHCGADIRGEAKK